MEPFAFDLNPNQLIQHIEKPPEEFTVDDIVRFAKDKEVRFVNFRYVAEDGKLRTLNFVITSEAHLRDILYFGERVDGSSLFSSIGHESSDLYVIPKLHTAFMNPFSTFPALECMCTFIKPDGALFESAPDVVLGNATRVFEEKTGMAFKVLGELEYYVNATRNDLYPMPVRKGYHQAKPFSKFEDLRVEAMQLIAGIGGKIKYGHSEVGSFTTRQEDFEQHEIEFLPQDPGRAADQLVLAKWVLRMLSFEYGIEVSFAPKITLGQAGSGLHLHFYPEKDGMNMLPDSEGLSVAGKKMIGGLLTHAGALTAFGNRVPTSYFRLVPNEEAPTRISWGDLNRTTLIRLPLGWRNSKDLFHEVNPHLNEQSPTRDSRQTIELRSGDGYIGSKDDAGKELPELPGSCVASAAALEKQREFLEKEGVFPSRLIDQVIATLKAYDDKDLRQSIGRNKEALHDLVVRYIHVA